MNSSARSTRPASSACSGGVVHDVDLPRPAQLDRVGNLRPQLERALDVRECFGIRVHALGLMGGIERRAQRASSVVRGVPVPRQLAGQRGRAAFAPLGMLGEQLGEPGVEPYPLAGEQVVVHGLAHERMPEQVRLAVLLDHEHLVFGGGAQAVGQLDFRRARERGDEPVIRAPADHRNDAQKALRALGERVDARQHDVAQRCRYQLPGAARGDQLFGEERVSFRPFEHLVDQFLRRIAAKDRRDHLPQFLAVEAGQLETLHGSGAVELSEYRAQWVAPVQVVGTVGAQQHDACVLQIAGEEHDQVACRVIGPVQVFEHQEGRDAIAEPREHTEKVFEQRAAARVLDTSDGSAAPARGARRLRPPDRSRRRTRRDRVSAKAFAGPAPPGRTGAPGS